MDNLNPISGEHFHQRQLSTKKSLFQGVIFVWHHEFNLRYNQYNDVLNISVGSGVKKGWNNNMITIYHHYCIQLSIFHISMGYNGFLDSKHPIN